jgi:hypothetical protein
VSLIQPKRFVPTPILLSFWSFNQGLQLTENFLESREDDIGYQSRFRDEAANAQRLRNAKRRTFQAVIT